MRIAQVAPFYESVPPKGYGGTERVVSYLTEELVRQGHDVTLFASGDSVTSAHLVASWSQSLRSASWPVMMSHLCRMLGQVREAISSFDVLHFHSDFLSPMDFFHVLLFKQEPTPYLTTLHWRLDLPDLRPLYEQFHDAPVASVSNAQREPALGLNWQGTVYHGLPAGLYTLHETAGKHLAFLGRLSPWKGAHRAIEIAMRSGMEIKVAGKIFTQDQEYFDQVLKPLLRHSLVEFVGEIQQNEKDEFLGNALAMLFPVDWPEPFGMAMIEAMACGTPTIAYRHGSVPEIIEDGVTGFIVDDRESAIVATSKVSALSRKRCRGVFEERFTSSRMAKDYLTLYDRIVQANPPAPKRPTPPYGSPLARPIGQPLRI